MIAKIAFANFRGSKKNSVISIIIISFSIILLTFINNLAFAIKNYTSSVKELPVNRMIMVDATSKIVDDETVVKVNPDAFKDYLKILPNVAKVTEAYSPFNTEIINTNDSQLLQENKGLNILYVKGYYEFEQIKLIKGKLPEKENEIIIPKYFQPNENANDNLLASKLGYFSGCDFLGKTFKLEYMGPNEGSQDKVIINAKVVGVYDSSYSYDGFNEAYISKKTLENVDKIVHPASEVVSAYILIDKSGNVQKALARLDADGFYASFGGIGDGFTKFVIIFSFVSVFVTVFTILICCLCVYYLTSSSIRKKASQIALFKSMGYSNKQLIKINLFEVSIQSAIGIIIATTISSLTILLLWNEIVRKVFSIRISNISLNDKFFVITIISNILLGIVIPFVSALLTQKKITRISPAKAVKG